MQPEMSNMEGLMAQARSLGATATVIIPAATLVVEDRFAALCGAPQRCPGYGLAPGCPPHALHPSVFREQLRAYQHILVFKIDAPVAVLMGPKRLPLARSIHRIAATLEKTARSRGMHHARGLAAGSCKELFCAAEEACALLNKQQACRHPDLARPSISALGVNFTALAESIGWQFAQIDPDTVASGEPAMGLMAGLVLLT
jgi:predicted metal-binding protein